MRLLLLAALAILSSACATTPVPVDLPVPPPSYVAVISGALPSKAAWAGFGDVGLTEWITQVQAHNTDVTIGLARLDASAAQVRAVASEAMPRVDAQVTLERQKVSRDPGFIDLDPPLRNPSNRISAQLILGYEIDLRGRVKHAKRASQADHEADGFDLRALHLSLARQTALLWFARAHRAAEVEVALQNQENKRVLYEGEEARRTVGLISGSALGDLAVQLAAAQAEVIGLRAALQKVNRGLCQLAALSPSECRLPLALPLTHLQIPVVGAGLPAALLERRPDLAAAQARYDAARARVNSAQAMRWPSLTLSGLLGVSGANESDLTKPDALMWSLMPQLLVPIFDAGRRKADVSRAEAQAVEQVTVWRAAVIRAVHEVENAAATMAAAEVQTQARLQQLSVAEHQLAATRAKRSVGRGALRDVLISNLAMQSAKTQWLTVRVDHLSASAELIAALGGGWEMEHADNE